MSYYSQISKYLMKAVPDEDGFVNLSFDAVANAIDARISDVYMTILSMEENRIIERDPDGGNRYRLLRKPVEFRESSSRAPLEEDPDEMILTEDEEPATDPEE
jgi:hypothetical protein